MMISQTEIETQNQPQSHRRQRPQSNPDPYTLLMICVNVLVLVPVCVRAQNILHVVHAQCPYTVDLHGDDGKNEIFVRPLVEWNSFYDFKYLDPTKQYEMQSDIGACAIKSASQSVSRFA